MYTEITNTEARCSDGEVLLTDVDDPQASLTFTRQMHGHAQRERGSRGKCDRNNFRDLQLRSTTPVVRHEAFNSPRPPHLTTFLQDMDKPFVF